jgi:predicted dehydrogenase
MAARFGAQTCNAAGGDPIAAAGAWTSGVGVDGVIITASAKSDDIMHQAAEMCRKRGRIILVGVVGLNLRRADFYEKELTFQVSCSYGAGRYDDAYERKGQDYPIGYVRWTEQRNFQAVLAAMQAGQLNVDPLITDRIQLADATDAYDKILSDSSTLGVILEYPDTVERSQTVTITQERAKPAGKVVAAMIGAGNFAKMTMAPALARTAARLKYVAELTDAAAARHVASKYGFENATTDANVVWNDPELNTVFIATGHSSHAALVCQALQAGKHVFVEKPLAMNRDQVQQIVDTAVAHPGQHVMVGFNRRFSPHVQKIKQLLAGRSEPLAMHFACNAGIIPPDVWVHDPELGGGRIIGEACHFIDLLSFIADSRIVSVAARQMGAGVAVQEDKMCIVLGFEDGSIGTVNYFGNGHKSYPKESMEVYSEGRILRLNNFRELRGWGFSGFKKMKTRLDKGHQAQFQAFIDRVAEGGERLIPLAQLVNVTEASFEAVEKARN